MRSRYFGILCIFLFFFSSFASAANISTNLENNYLDLGKIGEGEVLAASFFIINEGSLPVKISVESLGCVCFDIISPKGKVELAPGEKEEVIFNFDTTGFNGHISKPLYIYTTDRITSLLRVDVFADVRLNRETFINRFLTFGSLTILTAGLVDGINPCAFTVMVFFVSFLTFAGYRKKDMIIVGGLFILAIYLTYMLIGLGFFKTLRNLETFRYFSRIFYFIIAGFTFILGFINLYDFWIYKKTKNIENIVIKLPSLIKRKIQGIIRKELIKTDKTSKALLPLIVASLACGFLVSILELFCTGQLYLPTIAYILKIPDLKIRALFYFLLYNFMFIFPLIGVFILAFFGFTSSRFEKIARTHLSSVKLITAFLFFGLGALLLIMRA